MNDEEKKKRAEEKRRRAEDLAYGRWTDVLEHAGVDGSFLTGRHCPCPICGGTDRFRWSRKHSDEGLWACNQCTGWKWGNGFELLKAVQGFAYFYEAVDYVLEYFNGSAAQGPRRAPQPARGAAKVVDVERNVKRMTAIWEASRPITEGDPVDRYLKGRVPGLNIVPHMLRYHPALDYWQAPQKLDGKPILLGRHPAMVAKAFDATGAFVQLHKTYLTAEGNKANVPNVKKTERGVGINGFAVPLVRLEGDTLGISEGIESALAAMMLKAIPVWPCLNGPSMAAFDLPATLVDQIERVVIFADHDPLKKQPTRDGARFRSPGSFYAEQLADRVRSRGKRVVVVKAARVGHDMVDQWIAAADHAATA
jgi:putative DNA primase/helicase